MRQEKLYQEPHRSILTLVIISLTFAGISQAQLDDRFIGYTKLATDTQLRSEELIQSIPSSEMFGKHLLYLTEEPHPTGSERNMELAEYVRDRFTDYGLEEAHFHDTPALLSYGRSASVELLEPIQMKLSLREDPYSEDKDSYLYGDGTVVPYHEYAASGDVTAQVVYANSGSPEDFAMLDEMGVSVEGKIVIMRYSVPYSYRGYKVYMAESRGAVGVIIYSDPQDDGYAKGEVYPEGPWGSASHIQWGSIVYDWFGFGVTPFTFHWQQADDGTWVEGPERDPQLPKIPSIPMSYRDAGEILSRLRGPAVPAAWQGGLPFTYHVGPGPTRIRLRVENEDTIGTMRNVVAVIPGTEEPERWVIAGNHRDAWIYGAKDPSSGTATLLEAARALGKAVEQGFRPKRTIVFTNWDAEEDLLGGSTSWVRDHRQKLIDDGVLYVNLDSSAAGPDFHGGATPALAGFLREVTKSIEHPDGPGSVYDQWASRAADGVPEVETIVGATDYTAFQENVGMSCIDMYSDGPYGVYHSQYDNFFWMSQIADPGFRYNTYMSRMLAVLLWRMANAEILPLRSSAYARAVLDHITDIEGKAAPLLELSLDAARGAAEHWLSVAEAFEKKIDTTLAGESGIPPEASKRINQLLMEVERAMTEPSGLATRPFFKHLIYAPQPTYRAEMLPRIFEAIEDGDWNGIPTYEQQLVDAFELAASLVQQADSHIQ